MAVKPTFVIIDGANYAFRAFHAVPRLTNANGLPTNALYGFAQMLAKYVQDDRVSHLVVVWDAKAPSWRKVEYPEYKAHRKPMDPELREQMPRFKDLVEAFGIQFVCVEGVEADDVIATLAVQGGESYNVEILSTDKDLMQLVDDNVVMLDTIRRKRYDRQAVIDRWAVPPEQLRDLLALMGDSADNVPGVPGVGKKRAADLLQAHGTLENVLANIDSLKGKKLKENLKEFADQARLSQRLVTLIMDVELPLALSEYALKEPDGAACHALFSEFEFNRLLKTFGTGNSSQSTAQACATQWIDGASWPALEERLKGDEAFVLMPAGACLALSFEASALSLIKLSEGEVEGESILAALAQALQTPGRVAGYDVKGAVRTLAKGGMPLELFKMGTPAWDILLEAYLCPSAFKSLKLSALAAAVAGTSIPDILDDSAEDFAEVAGQTCASIWSIHDTLSAGVLEGEQASVMSDIELPVLPVLLDMERVGVNLSTEFLIELSEQLGAQIKTLKADIVELAGGNKFNPNSPKQLKVVLFEQLGLPVIKKTKTGPSTDHSVLEVLAEQHPLPAKILEFRSLTKLKNTYLDVLPGLVDDKTKRIHTTFNQAVAATGRLSSSDPNLQNIPIRTALGRRIREAFTAKPGHKLMAADYSQIELRLMAHMSADPIMVAAFESGEDIHTRTASVIYGLDVEDVTPDLRRGAKAINFGVLYGMGPHRLARDLGIAHKEAKAFIDQYFERFAGVRNYLDKTIEMAKTDGFVSTLVGRRRYLHDIHAKQFNVRANAERMATNAPLQGSAADLIKIAMIRIQNRLVDGNFRARMLLQVHDELLFEVPEDELEVLESLVRSEMESVMSLKVPLTVEVGIGDNWAQAH